MDANRVFEKYKRRLCGIGIKKAFLWALVIGFVLEFAAAFTIWFFHLSVLSAVLIMIGVVLVATIGATPILYFGFYRPTQSRVARMIDKLGLEERSITMCEHEKDDSLIARFQRADAQKKLEGVSEKQFLFHLSKFAAIALSISIAFGVIMGVISTFSASGILPSGSEIFAQDAVDPDDKSDKEEDDTLCIIIYAAGEGGIVAGENVQKLQKGQDTTPVTAMPDMGYEFACWSDGDPRATRIDYSVQESITITAMFVKKAEIELPDVPGGGGDSSGGPGGDVNNGDVGLGGGAGGSGNSGEMEGDDVNGDSGGGAGAMEDKEDNSVLDGSSDYKYVFDYDEEIKKLLEDEDLPDEIKDFLNSYLDALKQMQEADKNSN